MEQIRSIHSVNSNEIDKKIFVILLYLVLSIDLQLRKTVYRVICRGLIKRYAIAPCILSGT